MLTVLGSYVSISLQIIILTFSNDPYRPTMIIKFVVVVVL